LDFFDFFSDPFPPLPCAVTILSSSSGEIDGYKVVILSCLPWTGEVILTDGSSGHSTTGLCARSARRPFLSVLEEFDPFSIPFPPFDDFVDTFFLVNFTRSMTESIETTWSGAHVGFPLIELFGVTDGMADGESDTIGAVGALDTGGAVGVVVSTPAGAIDGVSNCTGDNDGGIICTGVELGDSDCIGESGTVLGVELGISDVGVTIGDVEGDSDWTTIGASDGDALGASDVTTGAILGELDGISDSTPGELLGASEGGAGASGQNA
jgi:hypothetical protein